MSKKFDIIENKDDNDKQYSVIFRNGRYEIDFFVSWLYIVPSHYRHNIGKFYIDENEKICFEFSEKCPDEIKKSMLEFYGNGTKRMIFTNELTGEKSHRLI